MRLTARTSSRFSIATLLLFTAAVAGYLGGRERGYIQGQNQWQTMPETIRSYYVGDITQPKTETSTNIHKMAPTLNELASTVNQEIIPSNWKRGKLDMISVDQRNESLIVTGNSLVHAELANFLAYLRRENGVRTYGIGDLFGNE